MKILIYIFIRAPRKAFRVIFYGWEYLHYHFFYSKPTLKADFIQRRYLVCMGDNLNDIPKDYHNLFPENVQGKIDQADLICGHIFDLLGSGPKKLSPEGKGYQPINWHSDFKRDYRWNPKTLYRDIRYGHIEGVDIKVPWELSRFQHLNTLGQAFVLTKNRKYSDEFSKQITDWIRSNPVGFGVNWSCTMDVAIRVANWVVAQEYFSDKDILPKDFLHNFYVSIYEHGKFIVKHLENNKLIVTTNHYIADLVGLFFIAVYCPFFKESKSWRAFALKELYKEIEKQVYPDGCSFEASSSYHRLVLEMFFYVELLGEKTGVVFPEFYKKKVRKMFEFPRYCIKSSGRIPQVGDNDNGRFLIFSKCPILEHKYLLNFAAIYYKDLEFKIPIFDFTEEAFWVFGKTGKKLYDSLSFQKGTITSKEFPDSGWYVIRYNNDYCFISCGPNGQSGKGGHAHNDKMSFELMLSGNDAIVDPGTYVYTSYPEIRNKFRSTEYHNTIGVRGYEQNEIPKKNMFSLPEKVKIKKAFLKETSSSITFQGELQYGGVIHKRTITLVKKNGDWQITDEILCPKPMKVKLNFHLLPKLTSENNNILVKETKHKIALIEARGHKLEKNKYDYSPEYGVKIAAEYLSINAFAMKKTQIVDIYIKKM